MNNTEYTADMFARNEHIIIDTSTLMNVASMKIFIDNATAHIQQYHRKIAVIPEIYLELLRLSHSENEEKCISAKMALEMINTNHEVFQVDKGEERSSVLETAHADPELLKHLITHRKNESQLLISNDRDLTEDAYKLNDTKSCGGNRIMICFVNHFGQLHMCNCVKKNTCTQEKPNILDTTQKECRAHHFSTKTVHTETTVIENTTPPYKVREYVVSLISCVVGYALGKYGKTWCRSISAVLK